MPRTLRALSALTVLALATTPCLAMSTSEAPSLTYKDGTLRLTDPKSSLLNNFSLSFKGSAQSYGNGNGYGYGYSNGFSSVDRSAGSSSSNPFTWGYQPSTNPGFSPTVPSGARLTDPTFGPNGLYTQGLRGTNP